MKKTLFILPILLLSLTAMSQEIATIEVEGKSEISVMPDQALIQVTLTEKAMKVADVTQALNKKTKSVKDALEKSGVKEYDLQINNYYVNVNRVYAKGTSKDSGYVASQNLNIKVKSIDKDLVKVVETLHQTTDMGFNIQFTISDAEKKRYQEELLKLALKDAQSKANLIAETMEISKINLFKVYHGAQSPEYRPMMKTMAMRAESADLLEEPVFSPEEQKLSDQVKVAYTFTSGN
ncbi:SIMPL domain-containing protein [Pararhodonellum marinum]|uniref:SIMPL domain-containing protein n=1 Tax=Pararhodonellum marinum TaxID=2755358 RepID=UPI00188FAB15|nr:SIMPL domain-containing protein [Pararhodonellum marinum]